MVDLQEKIWQSLDLGILDGALFAAEQNYTLQPSDESKFLHGLTLSRLGRYKSTLKVLEGEKYLASAYLYAQCCLKLEKAEAGIAALEAAKPWMPVSNQRACPSHAALQLLMGKLYELENAKEDAIASLGQSAKLDPYLYENLSSLLRFQGYKVDVEAIFKELPDENSHNQLQGMHQVHNLGLDKTPVQNPMASPIQPLRTPLFLSRRVSRPNVQSTPLRVPSGPVQIDTPLQPPTRKLRNITPTPLKTPEQHSQLQLAPRRRKFTRKAHIDREDTFLSPSTLFEVDQPAAVVERPQGTDGEITVKDLYRIVFNALKFLYRYESRQCLTHIDHLPEQHKHTASVLAITARAQFELLDYAKAVEVFEKLRAVDPFRTQDMEIFSTALWQLKKAAELGFLAHEMVSVDREAWQSWCVMGNSFSIQQDSANAIECFQRAISLDSKCGIAHSLQGHEHLLNEEYQTAIDCFRKAIQTDFQLYSAWLGLAIVYFRLEMLDSAEHHIAQAIRINANNSVLLCFMGVISEQNGHNVRALEFYQRALKLQPDCSPARYQIANSLVKQGRYTEALDELKYLQEKAPEDAEIQLKLGIVYRHLKAAHLSVLHLTSAAALDPKLGSQVKHELAIMEGN